MTIESGLTQIFFRAVNVLTTTLHKAEIKETILILFRKHTNDLFPAGTLCELEYFSTNIIAKSSTVKAAIEDSIVFRECVMMQNEDNNFHLKSWPYLENILYILLSHLTHCEVYGVWKAKRSSTLCVSLAKFYGWVPVLYIWQPISDFSSRRKSLV